MRDRGLSVRMSTHRKDFGTLEIEEAAGRLKALFSSRRYLGTQSKSLRLSFWGV